MIFDGFKASRPRINIVFGTDWWSDCDDVAALDILIKAHKEGAIDLKAIGVNSVMKYSAASVKALCLQYGLDSIPIGLDRSAERIGIPCLYQKKLAKACTTGFSNADCPDAYKLYRRALVSCEGKAVVVDVGFPQLIKEVLLSAPDEISDKSGIGLVKDKVSEIVIMGGRWDRKEGKEYNFCAYKVNKEAAAYICEECPVPVTFLGYEVANKIITGGKDVPGLTGRAYRAHFSGRGRPSWDPMTAIYAVTGDAAKAGYTKVRGKATVDPKTGKNSFIIDDKGVHAYLVKTEEDDFYKNRVEEILMAPVGEKDD